MCVNGLLGDPRDAPQVLRRRLCPTGVASSIGGGPGGGQARAVGGISPARARSACAPALIRASRRRSHAAGSCVAACARDEARRRGDGDRNRTGGVLPPGAERASAPFTRGHEAAERDERGGFAGHLGGEHAAAPQAHAYPRQLFHRPAVALEEVPHDAEVVGRHADVTGAEPGVGHAGSCQREARPDLGRWADRQACLLGLSPSIGHAGLRSVDGDAAPRARHSPFAGPEPRKASSPRPCRRASSWMARHESALSLLCAFSHRLTVEKLTPISAANVSWLMPRRRRRPRTLPALSFIVTPPPTWERAAATPSAPLLAP